MVLFVTVAVCRCCFCCCCHCFEDRRHLFLSQLFLCLSIYLSFNNCCGCGGCGAGCGCGCACDGGCGCCGCGGRRRRRLPSTGRVGLIFKKAGGGRGGRAQRLPPQCVLCDLHPCVVFLHCLDRFWWCHLLLLLFAVAAVVVAVVLKTGGTYFYRSYSSIYRSIFAIIVA